MLYEEIEVGTVYKSITTKPITGTEIDLFAQMSGMDLPGFLDAEFARGWGFKDRVVPGAYVIACMMGLMAKQGFLSDAVWTGATDISFKTPVIPGDRLSAEVEPLAKKESKRGGGLITYRWRIKNQEGKPIAEGTNT
ncbi:MAG: MaoC family dehydratase [Deltaproteobacteria bacterium]|nr:MaoC family dehydratase [Deltaproteobacteria bacterium]MBN2687859.1 MaoC family dehydratase [Deltaproteobacteria bacterium]